MIEFLTHPLSVLVMLVIALVGIAAIGIRHDRKIDAYNEYQTQQRKARRRKYAICRSSGK